MGLLSTEPNPLLNVGLGLLSAPGWGPGLQRGLLSTQADRERQRQAEQWQQLFDLKKRSADQDLFQQHMQNATQAAQREYIARGEWGKAFPELAAKAHFQSQQAPAGAIGKINAGNYEPASVQQFQQSVASGNPDYSLLKRYEKPQSPFFQIVPTASGVVAVDTRNPQNTVDIGAVRSQDDVALQSNLAGAKAEAGAVGQAAGQAQAQLPQAANTVSRIREQINALKAHPGKANAVGGWIDSTLPARPGTPKADFLSRLGQIHGGAFLQARQELKGGGSISDAESLRAEKAYARMSRSLKEEDFDKALDEFVSAVEDGYRALESTANRGLTINIGQTIESDGFTLKRTK